MGAGDQESEGTFLGVTEPDLLSLGKVSVAAGRLESVVRDVAFALGLTPSAEQFSKVASEARATALRGNTLHDRRCSPDRVTRWIDRARSAMKERDGLMHSALSQQKTKDGWIPIRRHLRSAELIPFSANEADAVAGRLADVATEGLVVESELLPQPRRGVFLRRQGDAMTMLIHEVDGAYPASPTDAEWAGWQRMYGHEWLRLCTREGQSQ